MICTFMFGAKLKVRDVSTSCRLFTVCPFYRVSGGVAAHAATPPNQPQRCILTDYFNNCNFSKLK